MRKGGSSLAPLRVVSYVEEIEQGSEVLGVALPVLRERGNAHPVHVLEQVGVHVSVERRRVGQVDENM